ncbi:MAG TPA: cation diffusion facilitator family transporter [Patescibacteria group bacterium]|nr:cation diffusion facilitator family transporter [Patescibacteria group bacterium]
MTHEHEHDVEQGHGHGHGHEHDVDAEHQRGHGLVASILTLIRPHSHDTASKVDSAMESDARGVRALKVSLIALLVTGLLQLVVVLLTNSVALLSDTLHNVADAFTALPIWLAFILARRPATRRFAYGFGRAEDLAGLVVLVFIGASALFAAYEAIHRLANPAEVRFLWAVAIAGIVGFAGNEWVARYRMKVGRQIGSGALVADGLHARADAFTSLAVVAGAAGIALGFPLADPIAGLIIAVMILSVLKGAARDVLMRIMDGVDPAVTSDSEAVLRNVPSVEGIGTVRVRWIGHRLHAEAEVVVDEARTVGEAHEIAERARHALLHGVPHLSSAIIHADPCGHGGADHHADLAHHRSTSPARPEAPPSGPQA